MDNELTAALIGASATIVAALIGLVAVQRGKHASTSTIDQPPRQPVQPQGARWRFPHPSVNTKVIVLATVAVTALSFIVFVVIAKSGGCRKFVPLTVTTSIEKDTLLDELAEDYAKHGQDQHGVCAQVTVSPVSSGDAMEGLVNGWGRTEYTKGKPEPHVWTPTSSMWVKLYRQRKQDAKISEHGSVTRSQLVIAMPKSIATAVGWPKESMSWEKLKNLATSETPWERYPGLPQGQPFIIRKDNPKYSTSGLASTVAAYQAAHQKLSNNDALFRYVRSLESGVEYTHDVMELLAELSTHDAQKDALTYLSAVVMQEELVYLYNSLDQEIFRGGRPELNDPLHIFYPTDGLLPLDHPYVVLSSDSAVRDAAESFRLFLVEEQQQRRFMKDGFRHVKNNTLSPTAEAIMNTPGRGLPAEIELPEDDTLDGILDNIDKLRRKARVLLVLDVSGSMEDEVTPAAKSKIQLVQDAVNSALGQLNPNDEIGLMTFSSRKSYTPEVEVTSLLQNRQKLTAEIQELNEQVGGGTALYDAVRAATKLMAASHKADLVNAVVVLTDGIDTAQPSKEARAKALTELKEDLSRREHKVPVYTIGFGLNTSSGSRCEPVKDEQAEPREAREALKAISDTTHGSCFNAASTDPSYINEVFVDLFRHF